MAFLLTRVKPTKDASLHETVDAAINLDNVTFVTNVGGKAAFSFITGPVIYSEAKYSDVTEALMYLDDDGDDSDPPQAPIKVDVKL